MKFKEDILAHLPARPALLGSFARDYVAYIQGKERLLPPAEKLVEHVRETFDFIRQYAEKKATVRVHNPSYTTHSVVDVLLDDQPFVIDTVWMQLQRRGWGVHYSYHPLLAVKCDKKGQLQQLYMDDAGSRPERKMAFIHVAFDRQSDDKLLKKLKKDIEEALSDARRAVQDFGTITATLEKLIGQLEHHHPPSAQREENIAFLNWLLRQNFIFVGYRHYDVRYAKAKGKEPTVGATAGSELGVLRNKVSSLSRRTAFSSLAPNLREYLKQKDFLTITKTLEKSNIHRNVDMDYIGVREYDQQGRVCGEHRFIGLFTSKAYTTPAMDIPIIGQKIREVLKQSDLPPSSHNYKALQSILTLYPRDELFHLDRVSLSRIGLGILHLQERQHVRVFLHKSAFERMVSVLVFLPLERMSSQIRLKIQQILMDSLDGTGLDFRVRMGEGTLARLFFKIRTASDKFMDVSEKSIESQVISATLGWVDNLRHLLIELHGEDKGLALYRRYEKSFGTGYQERTSVVLAVQDIEKLEHIGQDETTVRFTYCKCDLMGMPRLRVFSLETPIKLSDIMPLFGQMGLVIASEHPFKLHNQAGQAVWLHDFEVVAAAPIEHAEAMTKALELAWLGAMEGDPLSALIIKGGVGIFQVTVLRALVAYLQQTTHRYAKDYVQATLLKYPAISKLLADLFVARFDPALTRKQSQGQQEKIRREVAAALKEVPVLDEDRILQRVQDVILAAVRTNAWQQEDTARPLAIKIDSTKIPDLVKPVPWREIFVYSPRLEGIHLRGGPVARGGLRWSERPADFRTEVLGLMKAQMTKNTIIVPTGAKGGFVIKRAPAGDRSALFRAVEDGYRDFIQALLSVTDNRHGHKIVPPVNVVRWDADDAYFVVAADKGTATFSDIANEEAMQAAYWGKGVKGFWLGDAFASGGSNGYDHKGMGITARGAWEPVKHHFQQLDKDIQKEDFTVVGIGDMAGDVFGNGMLLSRHIQLVGAFNHMHIFVDPAPDAARSYKERERMFKTPGLTWADYNSAILSPGGRIYERSAKEIKLTPQIRKRFNINKEVITPNDMIRHLLLADVDLLWNGGIGTYIKARSESHQDVADRANDEVRVNGHQVCARVIGEGGNLGVTQLGRVEYALQGGLINTDALDNAAGVNTSDHEVNIKILLAGVQASKKLAESKRRVLLKDMTEDIARLVLEDNAAQALTLTLKERQGVGGVGAVLQLQQALVRKQRLDPPLEFLPTEEEVEERHRQGKGYTRPELSVFMAYAKADIYDDLIQSDLPDDSTLTPWLENYFPSRLAPYERWIGAHPLRRELIATLVTNRLVNRMGLTFLNRMREETGYPTAEVASAFVISSHLLEADRWWDLVVAQTGKIPADVQFELYDVIKKLLEFGAFWLLRNGEHPLRIGQEIATYQQTFNQVGDLLHKTLSPRKHERHRQRVAAWQERGLDPTLAEAFAQVSLLVAVPDLAKLVLTLKPDITTLMKLYFMVGDRLQLARLHTTARYIPISDNWQRVASVAIIDELYFHQRRVTQSILARAKSQESPQQLISKWVGAREGALRQYDRLLEELFDQPSHTHAMLNVMLGQLKGLTG